MIVSNIRFNALSLKTLGLEPLPKIFSQGLLTSISSRLYCKNASVLSSIKACSSPDPSQWGDRFLLTSPSDLKPDIQFEERIVELKKEIQRMLHATAKEPLQEMKLINTIQRLGFAYHFESEIEDALGIMYNDRDGYINFDLYGVALRFRLLRQAGYYVSPDVFKRFKNEIGQFHAKLSNDVIGMLSLYEAAHVGFHGEDILDEAITFTTHHLKLMVTQLSPILAREVKHALELPLHKRFLRMEAREYISMYQEDKSRNELLLEFAKLDFNMVQSVHLRELDQVSRVMESAQSDRVTPKTNIIFQAGCDEAVIKMIVDRHNKGDRIGCEIGAFAVLAKQQLNWNFLRALLNCWNPNKAVFEFGDFELCPTLEEIASRLKMPLKGKPAYPMPVQSYKTTLARYLCMNPSHLINNGLDSSGTYSVGDMIRMIDQKKYSLDREKARELLALGHILFPQGKKRFSVSLCTIIDRVKAKEMTLVPMILAHLLKGLNMYQAGIGKTIMGSMTLLQTWAIYQLPARIKFPRPAPIVSWESQAAYFCQLKTITHEELVWTRECTGQEIIGPEGSSFIFLFSPTGRVAYAPRRLLKQLGYQPTHCVITEVPVCTAEEGFSTTIQGMYERDFQASRCQQGLHPIPRPYTEGWLDRIYEEQEGTRTSKKSRVA